MSYSLEYIENLSNKTVLQFIHTVDSNYQSKSERFNQYALAYLAFRFNQLPPKDVQLMKNSNFAQFYLFSNRQLINTAKRILGPNFRSKSRVDLIHQMLNDASYLEPVEIYQLLGAYLSIMELRYLAAIKSQSNLNQLLTNMSKSFEQLLDVHNYSEIIRRIEHERILIDNYQEVINAIDYIINHRKKNDINKFMVNSPLLLGYLIRPGTIRNAARTGNLPLVKYLVGQDADINHPTIIENAASSGNLTLFKYLIEQGANPHHYKVLMNATTSGNSELVNYINDLGYNPQLNRDIFISSQFGNLARTRHLLTSFTFYIPHEIMINAVRSGNLELVQYLIGLKDTYQTLGLVENAVLSGNLDLVRYLIEELKISPTPILLEYAAESGNLPIVQYLIDLKVPISNTAVRNAIKSQHLAIVQLMTAH